MPTKLKEPLVGQQMAFELIECNPIYWDKVADRCKRGICEFCYSENLPGSLLVDRYCERCFVALTAGQPAGFITGWRQPTYANGEKAGDHWHASQFYDPATIKLGSEKSAPDPNPFTERRKAAEKLLETHRVRYREKLAKKTSAKLSELGSESSAPDPNPEDELGSDELSAFDIVNNKVWANVQRIKGAIYVKKLVPLIGLMMAQKYGTDREVLVLDPNQETELGSEVPDKDPNSSIELGSEYDNVQPHYLVKLEVRQSRDCRNFNAGWVGSIECKPVKSHPYYYWRHYQTTESGGTKRASPYLGGNWHKALNKLAQLQSRRLSS
jgi:hypothetical protein